MKLRSTAEDKVLPCDGCFQRLLHIYSILRPRQTTRPSTRIRVFALMLSAYATLPFYVNRPRKNGIVWYSGVKNQRLNASPCLEALLNFSF